MQTQCADCGKHLSHHSIWRHKKKSCNGKGIDATDFSSRLPTVGVTSKKMQTQCADCGKHLSHHSIWRHKKKSCNGKGIDATDFSSRLPTVDDEDENMSSRKRYALADYTGSVRMWTTRRRSNSGKEIIEVRICR